MTYANRGVTRCVPTGWTTTRLPWNGTVGLAPLTDLGEELKVVPLADMPPSPVVLAWKNDDPLIRSFIETV